MNNRMMTSMPNRAVNMVSRPEYPLHIQMLFTARPPLPYIKPPIKPRCRGLDPMIGGVSSGLTDYLDRFEDELEQEAYVKQKSA